jgi:endonuclease III
MITSDHQQTIAERLLELDPLIDWADFFPALVPGASEYALSDPFAFLTAAVIDRGKSQINWTVPFWLRERWGELSPRFVYELSPNELESAFAELPRKPRFWNHAPRTLKALAQIIMQEKGGDAKSLWLHQRPSDVKATLLRLPNVGPGIANMTVQLIERVYPGELRMQGTAALDIKCDVHTRRVLYRLGVAGQPTDAGALEAARTLHPEHPGKLDGALWYIGHRWCREAGPRCFDCYVSEVCSRRGL